MKTLRPSKAIRATLLLVLTVGLVMPFSGDAQIVGNAEFSTPPLPVGTFFQGAPATGPGQPWTFAGRSGVAKDGGGANGSFEVADISYSGQYAYIQRALGGDGSISQTVSSSSTGRFAIFFLEAGRVQSASGSGGDLNYTVKVTPSGGGPSVLSVTNTSASDQPFTVRSHQFRISTPGDYTISFSSLSHNGRYNDSTVYIDAVNISPVLFQVAIEVSQVRLCWPSETKTMYQVQYRSELTINNWVNWGAPIQGNGTTSCITDDVTGPPRFYRVAALP